MVRLTGAESHAQEMDGSREKADNSLIKWRRDTIWELRSFGFTIDEIVSTLKPKEGIKISHGTVSRDIHIKERQIEKEFSTYIERLATDHSLALTRVRRVIKEAGRIYAKDENKAKDMLPIILSATKLEQELLEKPAIIQKAIETTARLSKVLSEKKEEVIVN